MRVSVANSLLFGSHLQGDGSSQTRKVSGFGTPRTRPAWCFSNGSQTGSGCPRVLRAALAFWRRPDRCLGPIAAIHLRPSQVDFARAAALISPDPSEAGSGTTLRLSSHGMPNCRRRRYRAPRRHRSACTDRHRYHPSCRRRHRRRLHRRGTLHSSPQRRSVSWCRTWGTGLCCMPGS